MKIAKSLKWFSLVLALVLAMSGSALAYSDRNLEAPKAKDVVIDGDLSEWDLTRCLTIDSESQIVDQIEHWDGAEDCSMEIYAMWDEEKPLHRRTREGRHPLCLPRRLPAGRAGCHHPVFEHQPDADPDRTAYEATDWRIVQSTDEYDFFNYVDRSMVADNKGYETQGEYGDELVFDDYEAATVRDKEYGGLILESKIPLHNLSNDQIPQLVPAAGMTIGFDFSVLDVDLPCPGIHSLRMQSSANLEGRDRTPASYDVDTNPSLWGTLTFVEE